MIKLLETLEAEKKELKTRIKNIDAVINSYRKVCKHVNDDGSNAFVLEGNDSHYTYYTCSICGETEKV